MLQPREPTAEGIEQQLTALAVVDIGGMDHRFEYQANRVHEDLPKGRPRLRPFTFLPPSKPRGPPCSVIFALWLSMIAALGVGSRPARRRTRTRSRAWIRSHVPSMRHAR